jgi:hypothetical protein
MQLLSPPSGVLAGLLADFVAAGAGDPGISPANEQAAPLPDDGLKALKRKRHAIPLTSTSLAGQLGIEVAELDDALHGRPVLPQATERLAAWALG